MMSVYVRNDVTTLRPRIVHDQYNTRSLLEVLRGSIACSSAALSPGIGLFRLACYRAIQIGLLQGYSDWPAIGLFRLACYRAIQIGLL